MLKLRPALALVACAALAACSAMTDPTSLSTGTPRSLAKWVLVSPASPTLAPNQTLFLSVQMLDENGDALSGQPESWSSSNASVVAVDSSGLVTAHGLGTAKVYVTSGTTSAYADITVSNEVSAPHWVSVTPGTGQVSVRSVLPLIAIVSDASGRQVPGIPVTWSSSNSAIANVDATGAVTGVAAGTVAIAAHAGSNQSVAQITVVTQGTTTPVVPPAQTPVGTGSLYSGYSPVSPHWPHMRTAVTDFYYSWTGAERSWAGQHYDLAMSGDIRAWKSVNPGVRHYAYVLLQATLLPSATPSQGSPASQWYDDAVRWYSLHPQFNIETAFLHEAGQPSDASHRLKPFGWASYTWVLNPSDPGLIAYQSDRFKRLSASEDGLFIDSQASGDLAKNLKDAAGRSQEYASSGTTFPATGAYFNDYSTLMRTLKSAIGSKSLQPNMSGYNFDVDFAITTAAGATHMEKANNPLSSNLPATWSWIDRLIGSGVSVNFVTGLDYIDMTGVSRKLGNSVDSTYRRVKMAELASYYMVVPSSPDKLQLQLVNTWDRPFSSVWIKAQEANIGHPTGPRQQKAGLGGLVYQRDFDRGLIVMHAQTGWDAQQYDDATAISIPLPAGETWLPLHADGTLGAPVTSVKLRNAEAAILVKQRTIS
jgi:Big-like domain-containing protein